MAIMIPRKPAGRKPTPNDPLAKIAGIKSMIPKAPGSVPVPQGNNITGTYKPPKGFQPGMNPGQGGVGTGSVVQSGQPAPTPAPQPAPTPTPAFDEAGYLAANPDVAAAVRSGHFTSGQSHYDQFGKNENRKMSQPAPYDMEGAKSRRNQLLNEIHKRGGRGHAPGFEKQLLDLEAEIRSNRGGQPDNSIPVEANPGALPDGTIPTSGTGTPSPTNAPPPVETQPPATGPGTPYEDKVADTLFPATPKIEVPAPTPLEPAPNMNNDQVVPPVNAPAPSDGSGMVSIQPFPGPGTPTTPSSGDPYADPGKLADLLTTLRNAFGSGPQQGDSEPALPDLYPGQPNEQGEPDKTYTPGTDAYLPKNIEASPLYQFRLKQGKEQLAKLMSARGLTSSGAEIESLNNMVGQLTGEEGDRLQRMAETEAERNRLISQANADRRFQGGESALNRQLTRGEGAANRGLTRQEGLDSRALTRQEGIDSRALTRSEGTANRGLQRAEGVDSRALQKGMTQADLDYRSGQSNADRLERTQGRESDRLTGREDAQWSRMMDLVNAATRNNPLQYTTGMTNNLANMTVAQRQALARYIANNYARQSGGGGGGGGVSLPPFTPPGPSGPDTSMADILGLLGGADSSGGIGSAISGLFAGLFGGK